MVEKKSRSLANVIFTGTSWKFVTRFAHQIQRLTIGVILARLLRPEDFGLIAMVLVLTNFVALFRTSSLASALIQKKEISEAHISSIFWLNLLVGGALSGITVLAAPLVGKFYNNSALVPLTAFIGLNIVITTLGGIPTALLSRELNFKIIEIIKIAASLSSGAIAVVMVLRGVGVWALAYQLVLANAIQLLLLWIFSKWRPRFIFSWAHAKECFQFGFSLQGAKFVEYFSRNLDNLLIGKYIGEAALGFYDKAYQFMLIPFWEITLMLNQVLYPVFSAIQDNREKIQETLLQMSRYIGLIVFPLMLGLLVVSPEVIRVLYGEKWAGSIPLLQILCVAGLLNALSGLSQSLYLSQGRASLQFKWYAFSAVLRGIGFVVGLRWGVAGVAAAYVVVSALLLVPSCYLPLNLIGLRLTTYFRIYGAITASSVIMAGAVAVFRSHLQAQLSNVLLLFACAGVGVLVYSVLIFLMERSLLRDIFRHFKYAVR